VQVYGSTSDQDPECLRQPVPPGRLIRARATGSGPRRREIQGKLLRRLFAFGGGAGDDRGRASTFGVTTSIASDRVCGGLHQSPSSPGPPRGGPGAGTPGRTIPAGSPTVASNG